MSHYTREQMLSMRRVLQDRLEDQYQRDTDIYFLRELALRRGIYGSWAEANVDPIEQTILLLIVDALA